MSGLLRFLSRVLEPQDREPVLGDLTESGASDIRSFFDGLDLVVRRQLSMLKGWRPWLLIGVAGVSGLCLSEMLFRSQVVILQAIWSWQRDGLHYEKEAAVVLLAIAMFCWSMINGFILRRYSGRVSWATGALFYFVVVDSLTVRQFYSHGSLSRPDIGLSLAEISVLVAIRIILFDIPAMLGVLGRVPRMRLTIIGKHPENLK